MHQAPLDRFYSVIPAGGVGSRLWPLSRADAPKFLHDLTGSGPTLLRDTWDRLAPLSGEQRIMVVTGRAHRAAVEAQLPELADENIVLESEPRDSTAAIGLAAAILERREPGVIIGSFAADHVISGTSCSARRSASRRSPRPRGRVHRHDRHHPDRAGRRLRLHRMRRAARRPRRRARLRRSRTSSRSPTSRPRAYLEGGEHLWNAGMFIARADRLLEEIARTKPELHAGLLELAAAWDDPATRGPAVDRIWPALEKIAIDYSVAEPAAAAGRLAVIRGHFQWDDVGDFASLAKLNTAGRSGELAILGENARVLSDASSGIVVSRAEPGHQPDRRARYRRGGHARRAPRHHERARPAGEGRRRRPAARRIERRAVGHARERGQRMSGAQVVHPSESRSSRHPSPSRAARPRPRRRRRRRRGRGCVRMVTNSGGLEDRSFNQSSWEGLQQAEEEYGVEAEAIVSTGETDLAPNVQQAVDSGCELVVTVGYELAEATLDQAEANPDIAFAIVDEIVDAENVKPVVFDTAQASFLAGYLAAGVSKTGVVATFGGGNQPPVTLFMDGFVDGVAKYNEVHGTRCARSAGTRRTGRRVHGRLRGHQQGQGAHRGLHRPGRRRHPPRRRAGRRGRRRRGARARRRRRSSGSTATATRRSRRSSAR